MCLFVYQCDLLLLLARDLCCVLYANQCSLHGMGQTGIKLTNSMGVVVFNILSVLSNNHNGFMHVLAPEGRPGDF